MIQHDFDQMRRAMVSSQLRTSDVSDPRVVAAMEAVPRERFVPAARAGSAYVDAPIPLAGTRAMNAPLATGRLVNEASPVAGDHVLVVGSATGYAAAVLARLVGSIVALEEDAAILPVQAGAGAGRVRFVQGPLAEGWAEGAPYDLILIDGAVESVPQAIVDQLADGGRLTTGIVDRGVTRVAVGRKVAGTFGLATVADIGIVVLPGFARPPAFTF